MNARPFARQMLRVLNGLATRVDPSAHPLLKQHTAAHTVPTLVFVITSDKGLCGSFNTNIIKAAAKFVVEPHEGGVSLGLVGRKGRDYFRRRGFDVRYEQVNLFQNLSFTDAQMIARTGMEEFVENRVDSVYLVYNEFKSVIQQRIVIERLLPIARLERAGADPSTQVDYIYEPSPQEIFKDLIPHHVEIQVYRALLESAAAENAARMTAMDSATKNATEMIDALTLYMNKVRQAAITREIIEVVSGAQSL